MSVPDADDRGMMMASLEREERVRLAALRMLEARPLSSTELAERLAKRKLPKREIGIVVARMVELGIVDDARLAADVARREERYRPAGPALLHDRLEHRGIEGTIADGAVSDVESRRPVRERATELAQRAAEGLPAKLSDRQRWGRVLGALARRGFDEETAMEAAGQVLGTPPDALLE
ncbi:MAG: regulatory protein RecX [Planctomycetota bacterium]